MTKEELIGKKIKIIESKNKSLKEIEGVVVDESKNMLSVDVDGKTKKVMKDQCVFMVDGKKIIGSEITKRPEERIKNE